LLVGAIPHDHWRPPAEAQAFGRALLRPRDLYHAEGIDEREVLPRARVAIGPKERESVVAGMHQGQPKTLDQGRVDVADEVAEVIDGDDEPGDARMVDGWLIDPRRHQRARGRGLTEVGGAAAPCRELGPDGCEDVPSVEGGARVLNADSRKPLRPQAHDRGPGMARDQRRQEPIVRRDEQMLCGGHDDDVPGGPHPGVDDRHVYGAGREVLEGSGQPEPCLGRPMNHDLVSEVDDPRRRQAAEDTAFHDTYEGTLVSEVRRDGNDAGRPHCVSTLARGWRAARGPRAFRAGAAAVRVWHSLQPFFLDGLAAAHAGGVAALLEAPQGGLNQAQLVLRRFGDGTEDVVRLPLRDLLGEIRAEGVRLVSQVSARSARPHLQLLPALEQACAYGLCVHRSLPANAGAMLVRNITAQ